MWYNEVTVEGTQYRLVIKRRREKGEYAFIAEDASLVSYPFKMEWVISDEKFSDIVARLVSPAEYKTALERIGSHAI